MSDSSGYHTQPALDPSLYTLDEAELAFLKAQTEIQDETLLRNHIIGVQAEAYEIHSYPCIRLFEFARCNVAKHPAYPHALRLGNERKDGIFLELGCCMGTAVRKLISDGFPRHNVIASDLHAEFWTLGHKLFRTTQETFPVTFVAGNIFDLDFVSPTISPAPTSATPTPVPPPALSTLTSLTPLQHCISCIYTSMVFHLFEEQQQRTMAHLLGALLSPLPGSMIFGVHMSAPDTEQNVNGGEWTPGKEVSLFAHSATSWERLWIGEGGVFGPDDAVVKVGTKEILSKYFYRAQGDSSRHTYHLLYWSVTRI